MFPYKWKLNKTHRTPLMTFKHIFIIIKITIHSPSENSVPVFTHLLITSTLFTTDYYLCFIDEEIEAQRS